MWGMFRRVQQPVNPVPMVGWFKRISNYRFLRKLGFDHKIAKARCRYNCGYLREKPQHRRWFVPGELPKRLRGTLSQIHKKSEDG